MRNRTRHMVVALSVLFVLAAACGGGDSSTLEYKDPDETALFRVPSDWHIYTADELTDAVNRPFVTNFGSQLSVITEVGFDGAPGREVTNLNESVATVGYPIGTYVVRAVGPSERDAVSRALLEQTVLWPEAFSISEQSLVEEDFEFGRDFDGIRRFLAFQDANTEQEGLVYFISVTDPGDTRIFTMAAGCSRSCWEIYGDEIVGAVDSWLVNTRQ